MGPWGNAGLRLGRAVSRIAHAAERSARPTRVRNASSSNGFARKANAPPSSAAVRIAGGSPPVITRARWVLVNRAKGDAEFRADLFVEQPVESRQPHVEHEASWAGVRHARQVLVGPGEDLDGVVL